MTKLTKHIDKIILLLIISVFIFLNTRTLLLQPQIWPDEAYISDVANNIINDRRAGTDLWGDSITGIKKNLFWYPPLYTNILAIWFKTFGFSITSLRFFSCSLGVIFLIILYYFIQISLNDSLLRRKKWICLGLVFLLSIDNNFLKASKIGRPEMLVILLGFLSLYTYQYFKKSTQQIFFLITSGLFSALSFLTHFIGIFFFLLIITDILLWRKKIDNKFVGLVTAFILPVLFWLISILPNFSIFLRQLALQQSFRTLVNSHLEAIFKFFPIEQKIIYIMYILLSIISLLNYLFNRSLSSFYLNLGLLISWIICLWGKLEWYSLYIISFLYPLVINTKKLSQKTFLLTVIILFFLSLFNIKILLKDYQSYKDKQEEYYYFGESVKNVIAEGKTVYLSTIPDLYFLLKGRNRLYEFPGVKPEEDKYINILNDSDYLVVNFHLERLFMGNLLERYIEYNKSKEYQVGNNQLYKALIIELTPKETRRLPR